MDIAIRFWCTDKNEVATHYYSSAFLGHTTSEDLIQAFKVELKDKFEKITSSFNGWSKC